MPPEFLGQNICPRCEGYGTVGGSTCPSCAGRGEPSPPCICDADTILDGMATPGCPQCGPGDSQEAAA